MRSGPSFVILLIVAASLAGCTGEDASTSSEDQRTTSGAQAAAGIVKAQIAGNESAAIGAMRTIAAAQVSHFGQNGAYGSLADLGAAEPPFIDEGLASGEKHGYIFTVEADAVSYTATAVPQTPGKTGVRRFFADESGILRQTQDGTEPNASSPPIS